MKADNIYEHADGGFYCLLAAEAPMKHPVSGEWVPGVIYTGPDGLMRSTTRERWDERFDPVAEYTGDDESIMDMIRRCNPGNRDFDFVRVFEAWHESEINITGSMLELAVAATVELLARDRGGIDLDEDGGLRGAQITIKTEDLQRVLQTYEIEKVAVPHGFVFQIRK